MGNFLKHCIALLALSGTIINFSNSYAQDRFNADSIKSIVRQLSSDSEKVKAYIDMASVIYCEDSNSKVNIAKEAKKLAESIKWRKGIYNANRMLGQVYFNCLKNYP